MRKLFMAVAILGISATVSFAKAQCVNENGNKEQRKQYDEIYGEKLEESLKK